MLLLLSILMLLLLLIDPPSDPSPLEINRNPPDPFPLLFKEHLTTSKAVVVLVEVLSSDVLEIASVISLSSLLLKEEVTENDLDKIKPPIPT